MSIIGVVSSSRVFEGYRYTHAVVIGFDKNGKLLWDNSFEINDILTFNLERFVHVSLNEEKIALLYVYDNYIRSKVIFENSVIDDKRLTPISSSFEQDVVDDKSTKIYGLENWYNKMFYVHGTQKIKNLSADGVDLNREVFFIYKVIYK